MTVNVLIGGAAGQGIDTAAAILEKILKQAGYHVFTVRDFMSRIRGGHNFIQIRFGSEPVHSHTHNLDLILALNEETISLHQAELSDNGLIVCDSTTHADDSRLLPLPLNEISKKLGNPRVAGSVAIGTLMALFGLSPELANPVLPSFLNEKYISINQKAVAEGYKLAQQRWSVPSGSCQDWMILSGNKALALGALAAGLKFYAAYPMSPSTGIMEYLAEQSTHCGIVVEQAEDEIAAINMAIGASFAGVRSMTGTSGGGFSLMVEALGLAGITETPLVVVDVQRPGPATGLPTRTEQSDLKFVVSASQGEFPRLVIAMRHHQDLFYQTIRAFNLAERYQIPVIILSDQYLADASTTVLPFSLDNLTIETPVQPPEDISDYKRYQITESGVSPRVIPGDPRFLTTADSDEHDEWGRITESAEVRNQMVDKRMRKLDGLKRELEEPELIGDESCDILLVGWGSMYGPLQEAVATLNQEGQHHPGCVSALVFSDIFPLPTKRLTHIAGQARLIVNVEQNATGQIAGLIREYTGLACGRSLLKYDGRQMTGEEIVAGIRKIREVAYE